MKTFAKSMIVVGLVIPLFVTTKQLTTILQLESSGAGDTVIERAMTESIDSLIAWSSIGMCSVVAGVFLSVMSRRKSGSAGDE